MIHRSLFAPALMAVCLAFGTSGARAEQPFPTKGKPIRVIVASPSGVGVDSLARAVTPFLSQRLGVPVIVENRPGASSRIAATELVRSPPDGHTLFLATSVTFALNPHTQANWPFDSLKDFTPISQAADSRMALYASRALGVQNIAELRAYAQAHPGQLSYGSLGQGTTSHLFGAVLARQLGGDPVHVPFKGSGEIQTELMAGRLQIAFDTTAAVAQDTAGSRVKMLAIASPERYALLPGMPTLAEQGLSDLDMPSWIGWFGPAHMRPAVVATLNEALVQALAQPAVQQAYRASATLPTASTPQALEALVRSSLGRWSAVVKHLAIEKQ